MAQLRLKAGCCMLKLAQEPLYADAIKLEQFQTVALLASVSFRYMFLHLFLTVYVFQIVSISSGFCHTEWISLCIA